MHTWLTEQFEIRVPVIGAPMAGPGEGGLAAAVSAGGGLGMVGVNSNRSASWVGRQAEIAGAAGHRFGIGLLAWALAANPEQLDAAVASAASLVSVSFGDFAPHVRHLKDAGMRVTTQVGNLEEALTAERCGVDFLVVRGAEGGGHGRNEVGTLPLLQTVLDKARVPVVAAGGIANARGLAAVLAAGAAGAWVGTAFLGCREAGSSPRAREQLFSAAETGTAYGRVFDVAQMLDWPAEYGGRALRNRYFDHWHNRLAALAQDQEALDQLEAARADEDYETAHLYAGQGVGLLESARPAAEVLDEFATAEDLLRRF